MLVRTVYILFLSHTMLPSRTNSCGISMNSFSFSDMMVWSASCGVGSRVQQTCPNLLPTAHGPNLNLEEGTSLPSSHTWSAQGRLILHQLRR